MFFRNPIFLILIISIFVLIILVLVIKLIHYLKLSQTDDMTSIENYRGFQKTVKKIISKHKKNNTPFTISIIDIDEFRNYNFESYAFGDCVLKEFVKFLQQQLPDDAYIARFKFGDEFIIIMNTDLNSATEKINNVQNKCKRYAFMDKENQRPFHVNFSFGVSQFENRTETSESLLIKAEKALKANKKKT
jgi:diguanylate cyclase (GGDEF)-like protein